MATLNRYRVLGVVLIVLGILLIGLHTSWWVSLGVWLLITGGNFEKNAMQLEINRFTNKLIRPSKKPVFWKSTSLAVWLMLVGMILAVVYHIAAKLL